MPCLDRHDAGLNELQAVEEVKDLFGVRKLTIFVQPARRVGLLDQREHAIAFDLITYSVES